MKTPYISIIMLMMLAITMQAQSRHTFFLNTGFAYSNGLKLNGEKVQDSRAYLINLGLVYRLLKFNSFSIETGFAAKTIFSSGKINNENFDANTLRLAMPIKFVAPISDKWTAASGFVFQNNVDISEFDIRLRDKYSWRVDFLAETRYAINKIWYLTASMTLNLRDTPDAYFINDPKTGFQIGIARHTYIFKKKQL